MVASAAVAAAAPVSPLSPISPLTWWKGAGGGWYNGVRDGGEDLAEEGKIRRSRGWIDPPFPKVFNARRYSLAPSSPSSLDLVIFSRPLHIGRPIDISHGSASPIAAFVLEDVFASGSLDGTPSPSLTLPTICVAVFHGEYYVCFWKKFCI
jgi:hypothetical protein